MTSPEHGGRLGSELLRLIVGQTFLHASMAGTRMAAPLLALREGYSEAAVGFLLALFALASIFLALPSGRFTDRHGLHLPVGLCVGASVIGAGAAVAWPVFPVLCFAALMTGAAAGAASIVLQRHVGRMAQGPAQLREAFSWLSIGPAASNFFGPFLAGLLIDHGGFRVAFLALAILPVVCWLWIRTTRDLGPLASHAQRPQGTAWTMVREPTFRRLLLLNWVVASSWDLHTFIIPVLGHERGLSASVIGSLLGAFAIAAAVVRLGLPLVASRVTEWQVIGTACAGTALALAAYPMVTHALAMGACSVVLGLCLGTVQPMVMSLLHQVTPAHRHGEAIGLRQMVIQGSSVSMPLAFGGAGAVLGVAGVFWAVAALAGSGIALAMHGARRQAAPTDPHEP